MASNNTPFPQIPSTVWKGVWNILQRTPSRKLDDKVLAIELDVQRTAARQYQVELTRLGILNEDGTPSPLAGQWRQDGDDPKIITEILKNAYPDELLELAPLDDLDRDKVVRWFKSQNLGDGAAKNKAATYIRIASGVSAIDAQSQSGQGKRAEKPQASKSQAARAPAPPVGERKSDPPRAKHDVRDRRRPDFNVNVQIHISADASTEQINAIFEAMSRYFDNDSAI